jgi:hypothetical protein
VQKRRLVRVTAASPLISQTGQHRATVPVLAIIFGTAGGVIFLVEQVGDTLRYDFGVKNPSLKGLQATLNDAAA